MSHNRSDVNNFVSFGCWNQKGEKLKQVLDTLKRIETDAVFISGDNYYPIKKEKWDKVKGKMKKDKTIRLEDLREGFTHLVSSTIDKPVYMNFGNHDMVKNDGYKIDAPECAIMKEELKFDGRNMHVGMNHTVENEHTLIIMIDTTIYCSAKEFTKEFDTCYSQYSRSPVAGLQERLQREQRKYVNSAIRRFEGENVILIGHNPIIYEKMKDGKTRNQMDSGVEFTELLFDVKNMNPRSNEQKYRNIYYLCADYHQYEEGSIVIKRGDESVVIHQYIVGVGGTKLDTYHKKNMQVSQGQGPYTLEYTHIKTKTQHGLLQANFDGDWNFEFVPIRKGVARHSRNVRKASKSKASKASKFRLTMKHKTKLNTFQGQNESLSLRSFSRSRSRSASRSKGSKA
jgi:hypothetical protein